MSQRETRQGEWLQPWDIRRPARIGPFGNGPSPLLLALNSAWAPERLRPIRDAPKGVTHPHRARVSWEVDRSSPASPGGAGQGPDAAPALKFTRGAAGGMVPSGRYVHVLSPEPESVASCGKGPSANVIKLGILSRRDHPGLSTWALNPMTSVLIRDT